MAHENDYESTQKNRCGEKLRGKKQQKNPRSEEEVAETTAGYAREAYGRIASRAYEE